MDHADLPTADQLGVSEVEYERILRGLGRQAPAVVEPLPAATTRVRRRTAVWLVGVLVAAASALVGHHATSGKPEYAFLTVQNGKPVTYTSCKPVRVAVYPANGPSDATALVREAVDTMRSATGLDLVVTGAFGGYAPNWNFAAAPVGPDDPISVSWQDGTAIPDMTADVAGRGGSRVMDGPGGTKYLVAGTIALSPSYYEQLEKRGDHAEEVAVLLHEFGHVLGLAHVNSTDELMYHDNVGRTTYGKGDLEGLRRVGQGPCV